jgi:UDP-glucuronate 4-epimerase
MILVTGCAGFIGYNLALKLLNQNYKIIGVDNINNYYDRKIKEARLKNLKKFKNFIFLKKNICNFYSLFKSLKKFKFSVVIHLAAQPGVRYSFLSPNKTLFNNLNSFNNIIEIARLRNIKKFVYASSSSVYGEVKKMPFTENDNFIKPLSIYGGSKLSNEIVADVYSRNYNLNCIGLRFFTVYGPFGRPDMAYYSFSLKNLQNKKIKLFNNSRMLRDFTYIDDVILAIEKIIKRKKFENNHEILNVGKGHPDKLIDLVLNLQKNLKKKFKILNINSIPKGDLQKTYSSNIKIKKLLNWEPNISLEKGVKLFVDWFLNFYKK